MKVLAWLRHELRTVLIATAYFAVCFLLAILLKHLILEGYGIRFGSVTTALIVALVTAKVVVVLDKAPLGHRIGILEIVLRTALYTAAAFAVMAVEKALSAREAAGGFFPALLSLSDHPELPHIWASLICVGFAFAGYVAFVIVRREIGARTLSKVMLGRDLDDSERQGRTT